jgi:hypothetical protein
MTQEWPLLVLVMSGSVRGHEGQRVASYAAGLRPSTTGLTCPLRPCSQFSMRFLKTRVKSSFYLSTFFKILSFLPLYPSSLPEHF